MTRKKQTRCCPANGCTEQIPRHMAFCRTHWFWVPKPLRDAVMESWKKGRTRNWLTNLTEARRLVNERVAQEANNAEKQ